MKDAVIRGVLLLDTYRIFKSKFQVTSVTLWQCKKCAVTRQTSAKLVLQTEGVTKTLNAFLPALQEICEGGVVTQD